MILRALKLAGFLTAVVVLWQVGILAYAYEEIYTVLIDVLRPLDDVIGSF